MKPETFTQLLDLLVPEDSYRSPQVPTTRLGKPALVTIFGPRKGDRATHTEAPYQWVATDARSHNVLAYARTATVSPVGGFSPEPLAEIRGTLKPPEAYGVMRGNWDAVTNAFFAGEAIPADLAAQFADAYESTVPPRYLPWVKLCCSDFFNWLAKAAG